MKIFLGKSWNKVKKQICDLQKEVLNLTVENGNLIEKLGRTEELKHKNEEYYRTCIKKLKTEKQELNETIKKLNSAKGGYAKKINNLDASITELNTQIDKLKNELEEAKSGKYLVKKIPADKHKDTFGMKIKDQEKISKIAKQIHEV